MRTDYRDYLTGAKSPIWIIDRESVNVNALTPWKRPDYRDTLSVAYVNALMFHNNRHNRSGAVMYPC